MDVRTYLITQLDASRAEMQAVLNDIDRQMEIYPTWTIKHILAHITGWDEAVIASLRAYVEGSEAAIASYRGMDEYNERSVETRQYLEYDHIRREWEVTRAELRTVIENLPEEKLTGEILYPWGGRGAIASLVETFIRHEHDHAEEIEGLKGKTQEPG